LSDNNNKKKRWYYAASTQIRYNSYFIKKEEETSIFHFSLSMLLYRESYWTVNKGDWIYFFLYTTIVVDFVFKVRHLPSYSAVRSVITRWRSGYMHAHIKRMDRTQLNIERYTLVNLNRRGEKHTMGSFLPERKKKRVARTCLMTSQRILIYLIIVCILYNLIVNIVWVTHMYSFIFIVTYTNRWRKSVEFLYLLYFEDYLIFFFKQTDS
jgi:hypothetical protein